MDNHKGIIDLFLIIDSSILVLYDIPQYSYGELAVASSHSSLWYYLGSSRVPLISQYNKMEGQSYF